MIDFTINDQAIRAPEGTTILQAARENGIAIPHLCYHPALKPSGSCKLCGVEVTAQSGKPVVMLSCILKVKPGLKVITESELVTQAREKSFSRLLQMAPDARRIRDLAGQFQVSVPPPPDGCIQCRLCVRVCNDVVGAGALTMEKTAHGRRVTARPDRCIGCGTCANICPTRVISVTDRDGIRQVAIKGQVVTRLPLERCEACGREYATSRFLHHVDDVTEPHPHVKEHHHHCPNCVKIMSDKAVTERAHIPGRIK